MLEFFINGIDFIIFAFDDLFILDGYFLELFILFGGIFFFSDLTFIQVGFRSLSFNFP